MKSSANMFFRASSDSSKVVVLSNHTCGVHKGKRGRTGQLRDAAVKWIAMDCQSISNIEDDGLNNNNYIREFIK